MSATVEHLRQVQTDIRLMSGKLGELNSELKADDRKAYPGDSHDKQQAWADIKAVYTRRRQSLKIRLNDLEKERAELESALSHIPLTKASLSHVISSLSNIEAIFTVEGNVDAWDKLSAFIDWLEREEERIGKHAPLDVRPEAPKLAAVA